MKKFLLLIFVMAAFGAGSVSAKSGDIAGVHYSTDILTTLNGAPISAINIGGETMISAEGMSYLGFDTEWDNQARTLKIFPHSKYYHGSAPLIEWPDVPAGEPIGYYYETDIVTFLDGKPITAYNTGGNTYIHAEEMRNFGFNVEWNPEKWTLSIKGPDSSAYIYSVPLYYGNAKTTNGTGAFSVKMENGKIAGTDDADYFTLTFSRNKSEYGFRLAFYANQGLFYSDDLRAIMDSLSYDGLGVETPLNPADKYDEINKIMKISINGHIAEKVEIYKGGGNNHRDYDITVKGLPEYSKEDIKEFSIVFGEGFGEPYEIQMNEYANGFGE